MRGRTRATVASLAVALIGVVAALAPALGAAAGGEAPIAVTISTGGPSFNFGLTPKSLPVGSGTSAKLTLSFDEDRSREGESIGFGSLSFGLGKSITLNPGGVPICRAPDFAGVQVQSAPPIDCDPSQVGIVEAAVELALPGSELTWLQSKGKVYNGGHRRLLIELPLKGPLNGALDLVVPVHRVPSGPIASEATIKIPEIASGYGALDELRLELDRPGFVTAECLTSKLRVNLAATFRDGTKAQQETIRACSR